MTRHLLVFFFALTALICAHPLYAAQRCVVIMMHGKWGGPKSPFLKALHEKIEPVCKVEMRNMPWSRTRNYDQTYQHTLKDLGQAVAQYRKEGYEKIIIAGQSFGANAAIAYQTSIGDADAVIALSPGHSPHYMYFSGLTRAAVSDAKKAVASGQPEKLIEMTDLNQGQRKELTIRADVLISYFDPEGLGNMAITAGQFKQPAAFLWVIGTQDPLYKEGRSYAFDKVPNHPLNKYLTVNANHSSTPDVASDQVLEWIKQLIN